MKNAERKNVESQNNERIAQRVEDRESEIEKKAMKVTLDSFQS